ncbi:MAG: hypothetical protein ACTTKQ_00190 [Filifactor alocis]
MFDNGMGVLCYVTQNGYYTEGKRGCEYLLKGARKKKYVCKRKGVSVKG